MSACPAAGNPAQPSSTSVAAMSTPLVEAGVAAATSSGGAHSLVPSPAYGDPAAHLELDAMDELQLLGVVAAEGHGPFIIAITPHFSMCVRVPQCIYCVVL
jgi:hypothetical protein